jgi:uncharacterized protein GlcG (DUF336 family)
VYICLAMPVPLTARTTDIDNAEARRLIARAIDKAQDIAMRGAIAVIGGSGALVSASRMDHGGAGGMARARSKAWIAATQQIPSTEHLHRMGMVAPPMVSGFTACSPEAIFPGAGGMPIRRDGWVVAGLAASGAGIGPFVGYEGSDRQKLIANGKPANGEDLLVHYALGLAYEGQHGDDLARWIAAYGEFPPDAGPGLGMADPPGTAHQPEHRWALAVADAANAQAVRRDVLIAVAVVDSRGEAIQLDRMDGAPAASVAIAETTAATAATFGVPSGTLREFLSSDTAVRMTAATLPYRILPVAGGVPVHEHGRIVAGLGIGGPEPRVCAEIAAETASAISGL